MKLAELSIRRHVLAYMLSAVLILFGLIAYQKIGVDRSSLETALQSPEIKARLKDECEQALTAGVFGSPHVRIDGEAFFGADRLPQIEKWLEAGGF